VAANQGVIGLQEARRSGEQKRIAEALEERVAERTRQLTTANEQLRRSQAYLAEAQRLSHTGSWAFNASEAVYWSEENFLMWGFDPQQGLPNRETVLQRMHPEDRDRVLTCVQQAVREKTDYAVDFRIVLPDGTVKHIHGLGHPVFSATGELVEVVGTQLDVTDRKRAEEERERLRQAQADLARASRVTSMGELTASLAHEVKQPIGAAATNARTCIRWLARDHPDIEEAREAAARVANDVSRAAEIISRVHLLFRGGSEPQESIELNEVIQEMILLLHSEATQYSISVRADLAPNLGQVMGDRVQLQQVMMNLIMNSIDAMKEVDNPRELNIASRRAESEQQQLLVSVSDTGKGLPPQNADEIFNAFFTTKTHGTGMGLRISRSIIESHGGRLWAHANTPRGASFCFTLPMKP
jgi:PAS domain S-box-containing protein